MSIRWPRRRATTFYTARTWSCLRPKLLTALAAACPTRSTPGRSTRRRSRARPPPRCRPEGAGSRSTGPRSTPRWSRTSCWAEGRARAREATLSTASTQISVTAPSGVSAGNQPLQVVTTNGASDLSSNDGHDQRHEVGLRMTRRTHSALVNSSGSRTGGRDLAVVTFAALNTRGHAGLRNDAAMESGASCAALTAAGAGCRNARRSKQRPLKACGARRRFSIVSKRRARSRLFSSVRMRRSRQP